MKLLIDIRLAGHSKPDAPCAGDSHLCLWPQLLPNITPAWLSLRRGGTGTSLLPVAPTFPGGPLPGHIGSRVLDQRLYIPQAIRQHGAAAFVGAAGIISLHSPDPQIILLHDALGGYGGYWQSKWYQQLLPAMLRQAKLIVVPCLKTLESKIGVMHLEAKVVETGWVPMHPYTLLSNSDLAIWKKEQLGGQEYFLCRYGWQNTLEAEQILLAFGHLKKRLKTGIKLVLAGHAPVGKTWLNMLATYRYRHDVVLWPSDRMHLWPKLLQGAYAHILMQAGSYPALFFEALRFGVPTLVSKVSVPPGCPDSALCTTGFFTSPNLAWSLMEMYKNENLRHQLAKAGQQFMSHFAMDHLQTILREAMAVWH